MSNHTYEPTKGEAVRPGENQKAAGSKADAGKIGVFTGLIEYFPLALSAVAQVSDYGAQKYTRGGWRTVPDGYNRYSDAAVRHLLKGTTETYDTDPDGSDMLHDAQLAWNALARLQLGLASGRYTAVAGRKIEAKTNAPVVTRNRWSELHQELLEAAAARNRALKINKLPPYHDMKMEFFGHALAAEGKFKTGGKPTRKKTTRKKPAASKKATRAKARGK